jgi:hypothetical protein
MLGLNVNKTTSMLAKLADNALQGYASMHKSNPYILSLAVAEANRRKELRASRAAQSAPQPQQKVADVAIANMASSPEEQGYGGLPEQRGIGALPANNMRMMADGGIVGYDDQEPVQMMAEGGVVRYNGEFDSVVGISPEFGGEPPEPYSAPPDQASMRKVAASPYTSNVPRSPEEAAMLKRFPVPSEAANAEPNIDLNMGLNLGQTQGRSSAAPSMDIPGMFRSAMNSAQGVEHPYAKEIGAMGKERVKAAEEDVAGLEAIHKRFDDIFKGRKERMGTREEEVGKLKEEAGRMAGISFGLAMAKTPGKGLSGLLSGLTAGADAGSKEYAKGMDKFRAAQEKLNDAKDRLEDLEANRGEMNARELHKGRMGVRTTMIDAQKDMISANMEMYKLNREDSKDLVKAQVQYGIAQIQAAGRGGSGNRPIDIKGLYTQAVLQGNKPVADKLLGVLQKIGEAGKPGLDAKSRSDFMKDNKREIALIGTMSRSEDPKTMQMVADQKAALRESAIASGIDPNTIPALRGTEAGAASSTGQRTYEWNDITK